MGWDSFSSAVCKVLHFTVKRHTLPTVPVGQDPGPGLAAADHSGRYAFFQSPTFCHQSLLSSNPAGACCHACWAPVHGQPR